MAPEDAIWLAVVSGLVFLIYLDHLRNSIAHYRKARTRRTFGSLFIAVMLQVGLALILVSRLERAFPGHNSFDVIQSILSPVLTLLLLSGGFVLFWTWRHEP